MNKPVLILSSVLFSFSIILSSSAFAHDGELDDAHEKGSELHKGGGRQWIIRRAIGNAKG
jgi:hypothetical protein